MVDSTSGKRQKPRKGYADRLRRDLRQLAPGRRGRGAPEGPELTRAEERALVAAARGGDRRALSRLLTRLTGPVYRYGRAFCGDPHDAEDLTQTVLMALVRTLRQFRGESSLSTWTYSVAKRACARQRRRRAGAPAHFVPLHGRDGNLEAIDLVDRRPDPHQSWERARLSEAIERAIQALPATQRDVLILRDIEGLPAVEVGKVLHLAESVVKARLHRARATLREALALHMPERQAGGGARPRSHCRATVRLLSTYLEGDLSDEACAELRQHAESCRECATACQSLRRILGVCRGIGEARVPAETRAGVRKALQAFVGEWNRRPGR